MTSGQVGLNDWTYYPSNRDNDLIPFNESQITQWIPLMVFIGYIVLMLVLLVMSHLCRGSRCNVLCRSNCGGLLPSRNVTYQLDVSPAQAETQLPSARFEPVATHLHFPSAPPVPVPAGWSDPTAPPPPFEHPPTYTEAILKSHYGPIVNFPEKFH